MVNDLAPCDVLAALPPLLVEVEAVLGGERAHGLLEGGLGVLLGLVRQPEAAAEQAAELAVVEDDQLAALAQAQVGQVLAGAERPVAGRHEARAVEVHVELLERGVLEVARRVLGVDPQQLLEAAYVHADRELGLLVEEALLEDVVAPHGAAPLVGR